RYRKGSDVTFLYPELTRALVALPFDEFVLDGELVALDESGRPDFQRLQNRAQRTTGVDAEAQALETPVTLFVFDLLVLSGRDLRSLPLEQRKAFLKRMLPPRGPIRYADHVEEAGKELFERVQEQRLEGIVAKRASSTYRAGRSAHWLKIPADRISEFVVVGYTLPKGGRTGFGALHLASVKGGVLTYAGRVGTGFSDRFLREFSRRLEAIRIKQPLCQGAVPRGREHVWVEPHYIARVRFKKRTADNLLRQPVFLTLVDDLTPEMLDTEKPVEETDSEVQSEAPAGDAAEAPKFSISNPDKVFWPDDGITKGDLIEYYRSISDWILPYLRGRPVVLDRYPDGIYGKSFFQKNVPDYIPAWMRTAQIWEEGETRGSNLFLCDDLDSLLYLVNLGTIPLHIWSSRVESIQHPDWCVIDLDPKDAPFRNVVRIARSLRELCLELEIEVFLKSTGGSGLHLLIPLSAAYTHEQAKLLAELLARIVSAELPEIATLERAVERRESKVYIDCYQNGQGKLIVAPFSVRPYPRAPVSTPLGWEELTETMDVKAFNLRSVPERMQALGYDPMRKILESTTDLARVIERLSKWA
ncbi:MAG TPA: DNA ligase D, partial [Acidobacteriota bacterium]|nr:DNA ligase D [Acidobacteriota bacterium]